MRIISICLVILTSELCYSQDNYRLRLEGRISIDISNMSLKSPLKVEVGNGAFFWMSENSITVFDDSGFLFRYDKKGRGPGEFEYLTSIEVRNDTLYIYDNSLKKIMLFKITNARLEYLTERAFRSSNSRNFAINAGREVYFLNSHSLNDKISAITKFNLANGNKVSEFGNPSILAPLGRGLRGGGITESSNGKDIYYSYLGDLTLYKKANDGTLLELKDYPDFLRAADPYDVDIIKNSLSELILKAYEVSRVVNVFEHNNLIIRIIESGGPRMEGPTKYYLEVWENDKRVGSNITIPGKYVMSDGNYIYTTSAYETELISSEGRIDIINKYALIKE